MENPWFLGGKMLLPDLGEKARGLTQGGIVRRSWGIQEFKVLLVHTKTIRREVYKFRKHLPKFGPGECNMIGSQGTGGEALETREQGKAILKKQELSIPAPVEKD